MVLWLILTLCIQIPVFILRGPIFCFSRVLTLAPRARYGQGRDPIWLDDLHCPMNANTLADCRHLGWGSHNCGHSEDMGLICATSDHATSHPNVPTTAQEITTPQSVSETGSYQYDAGLLNYDFVLLLQNNTGGKYKSQTLW